MTVLVLESLAVLPAHTKGLRMMLARLARAIDALVSARAAREVPEWRMREVQSEINRSRDIIRAGACGMARKPKISSPHTRFGS
jgi:hypothetical protein